MQPKPGSLRGEYGTWFKDPLVVAAYPARPPYPTAAIQLLARLIVDTPRTVLDIGCGPGDLARRLAPLVDRVDAVDFSAGMLEQGRQLPGGDATNLRWILGDVERVPLDGPYALVTAGESLHWMEWSMVLPRLHALLTPRGVLAIVERDWNGPPAVWERLLPLIERYSPVRDYRPYALVEELTRRGLFEPLGAEWTGPEPWQPTIDDYLEARHSQRGLSRTHMGTEAVEAFDAATRQALAELVRDGALAQEAGRLHLSVRANVAWGKPQPGSSG